MIGAYVNEMADLTDVKLAMLRVMCVFDSTPMCEYVRGVDMEQLLLEKVWLHAVVAVMAVVAVSVGMGVAATACHLASVYLPQRVPARATWNRIAGWAAWTLDVSAWLLRGVVYLSLAQLLFWEAAYFLETMCGFPRDAILIAGVLLFAATAHWLWRRRVEAMRAVELMYRLWLKPC